VYFSVLPFSLLLYDKELFRLHFYAKKLWRKFLEKRADRWTRFCQVAILWAEEGWAEFPAEFLQLVLESFARHNQHIKKMQGEIYAYRA
jgi:hypothetical protein